MEEFTRHYRYDLDLATHYKLEQIIEDAISSNNYNLTSEMIEKLTKPKEIKNSIKKKLAASTAREAKSAKLEKRVLDAIEYLTRQNKKVNYSSVAAIAEVNRATAKKYTPAHYVKLNEHKRN